ncbi:MAG TPA: hypothetical protein PLZ93_19160 [Nocardioides sp.]|uniref:hypothetical protein n=1 Tax=uncultured Nocardioides sp. TaxID=198441 RepID=UPI00260B761B|nr:hypothetical protein [uncultured Nocardioides sp.]HRI97747.1 hypothetical protein [Nocardioides sp.]HRK48663.1 hypothetical protein [Nocardioides sp.]
MTTTLTADGALEVTHQIDTDKPINTLQVSVAQLFGPSAAPRIEGIEVTAGNDVLAELTTITDQPQNLELGRSVREVILTYRVIGTLDAEDTTVAGRVLARVPTLRVDYDHEAGPIRRTITAPGQILNVACVASRQSPPRPCGAADSRGWLVEPDTPDRDDALLVQIQLDQTDI